MEFELRRCHGTLTRGEDSLDIAFDLLVDRYGEVSIQFGEIPLGGDTKFLFGLLGDDDSDADLPALVGDHADGTRIDARYLQTVHEGHQSNSTGAQMDFRMVTRDLRLTMQAESEGARDSERLEYILPKLRCFRVGEIDTPNGRFSVIGDTDIEDYSELGGIVAIDLPCGDVADVDDYDGRVETLLDYLSLANGRLLRWSVRKHFVRTGEVLFRFRGDQAKASRGQPLFPYLHLRPAIEAALTNITPEEHRRLGLHIAISWALLNSQFTEANFQGMMTAFEHMLHVGLSTESKGGAFPRAQFREIRAQLVGATTAILESCGVARDDERTGELVERISSFNYRSFRSKVLAYLEIYNVPADDLLSDIPEVLELRNQVVHRGLADDYRDGAFDSLVDVARELLSRIFMTHLVYSGPYESYLGGNSLKQFRLTPE